MYYFSKEVNDIIENVSGVVFYDGKKVLFKKNSEFLREGLGIVLELSFKNIECSDKYGVKNNYLSSLLSKGGRDYIVLSEKGTEIYKSITGFDSRKISSLDTIIEKYYIGYGMKLIPKEKSVSYVFNNITSSTGLNTNIDISEGEIFGSRKQIDFTVNSNNTLKPSIDSYDYVMSHFKK